MRVFEFNKCLTVEKFFCSLQQSRQYINKKTSMIFAQRACGLRRLQTALCR